MGLNNTKQHFLQNSQTKAKPQHPYRHKPLLPELPFSVCLPMFFFSNRMSVSDRFFCQRNTQQWNCLISLYFQWPEISSTMFCTENSWCYGCAGGGRVPQSNFFGCIVMFWSQGNLDFSVFLLLLHRRSDFFFDNSKRQILRDSSVVANKPGVIWNWLFSASSFEVNLHLHSIPS